MQLNRFHACEWSLMSANGSAVPAVLVVDDEAVTRKVLELRLQSAGFLVESAINASEALQWIARRDFDAVMLDLLLPDMNGPEVLEQIRVTKPYMVSKVIVLSALDEVARRNFETPGVCAVLRKPVDHRTLIELVRVCVNTPP